MKDKATIRAKREGLRARSAYKLKELNSKYKFLQGANECIDLGSWPGGWSVVAAKYCHVTAIDLTTMQPVPNCTFIRGDMYDDELIASLPQADVVLSDAAPKTAGDARDQYKSFLLSIRALEVARKKLHPGGTFICKIFQGEDFEEFLTEVRSSFKRVKCTKPPTSRNSSKEIYVVAREFKSLHS